MCKNNLESKRGGNTMNLSVRMPGSDWFVPIAELTNSPHALSGSRRRGGIYQFVTPFRIFRIA